MTTTRASPSTINYIFVIVISLCVVRQKVVKTHQKTVKIHLTNGWVAGVHSFIWPECGVVGLVFSSFSFRNRNVASFASRKQQQHIHYRLMLTTALFTLCVCESRQCVDDTIFVSPLFSSSWSATFCSPHVKRNQVQIEKSNKVNAKKIVPKEQEDKHCLCAAYVYNIRNSATIRSFFLCILRAGALSPTPTKQRNENINKNILSSAYISDLPILTRATKRANRTETR